MPKSASIKYKRLNPKEVKITYQSNGKSTEIVARVVRPGTYNKCEFPKPSNSKSCD